MDWADRIGRRIRLRDLHVLLAVADPAAGELRIGCPEITTAGLLPPIIERFSHQYPRVRMSVTLANMALSQFGALRERSVDLLIGRMPRGPLEDDLRAEILFDEPY